VKAQRGNGARKRKGRSGVTAAPSRAQLAARERLVREAERETGVKITQADVDAVLAELAGLR
jgi:hypothetical protein